MAVRTGSLPVVRERPTVWGTLGQFFFALAQCIAIPTFGYPFCLLKFRLLNLTIVHGWRNITTKRRGVIYGVADHGAMDDSWAVGMPIIEWLYLLGRVHLRAVPYSMPDKINFFSNPFFAMLFRLFKGVPVVRKGKGALHTVEIMQHMLQRGNILVFTQAGRRAPGEPRLAKASGIGRAILSGDADEIIPVSLTGTQKVQRYRKCAGDEPKSAMRRAFLHIPVLRNVRKLRQIVEYVEWLFDLTVGNRVEITFGKAIPAAELLHELESVGCPDGMRPDQALTDLVVQHIVREGNLS